MVAAPNFWDSSGAAPRKFWGGPKIGTRRAVSRTALMGKANPGRTRRRDSRVRATGAPAYAAAPAIGGHSAEKAGADGGLNVQPIGFSRKTCPEGRRTAAGHQQSLPESKILLMLS